MRRENLLTVRCTDAEYEAIKQLAKERGQSLSDLIRSLVKEEEQVRQEAAVETLAAAAREMSHQFDNHAHRWEVEAYHNEKGVYKQSCLSFSKMAEMAKDAINDALREYEEVSNG